MKTVFDLVKMFSAASIPFNVAENTHIRDYFSKNIRRGEAIPRSDALNHYLTDIFTAEKDRFIHSQKHLRVRKNKRC